MTLTDLLKRHEGYSRSPYRCTAGALTIAHGRNLDAVGIDKDEAEYLLNRDIDRAVANLRNEPYWLDLSEVRQAVLISMVFNLGWGGFCAFQRMRAELKAKDYAGAASEMLSSKWAMQVRRRSTELAQMMESGEWSTP